MSHGYVVGTKNRFVTSFWLLSQGNSNIIQWPINLVGICREYIFFLTLKEQN